MPVGLRYNDRKMRAFIDRVIAIHRPRSKEMLSLQLAAARADFFALRSTNLYTDRTGLTRSRTIIVRGRPVRVIVNVPWAGALNAKTGFFTQTIRSPRTRRLRRNRLRRRYRQILRRAAR